MHFFALALLLAVPATVSACEGDCIVGITNAWLSNYTMPLNDVINSIANQLCGLLDPNSHPSPDTVRTKVLSPITDSYNKQAYQGMESAIFPSFFHGKCLDSNGVEPAGCPNPDCPVVCGTPGSLVHFFPKLRYIAFNETYHLFEQLIRPGSSTYEEAERNFLAMAASSGTSTPRRRNYSRIYPRNYIDGVNIAHNNAAHEGYESASAPGSAPVSGSVPASEYASAPPPASGTDYSAPSTHSGSSLLAGFSQANSGPSRTSKLHALPIIGKRSQDLKAAFRSILQQLHSLLEQACGGSGDGATYGLPKCSWEPEMKKYILTFP